MSHAHPIISTHPSLHCHITSINARLQNRTLWGNGKFETNLGNSFGVTKAIKLVPTSISIPNIFPNVRKTWLNWEHFAASGDINLSGAFEEGFYNITEFLDMLSVFTTSLPPAPLFELNEVTGKIEFVEGDGGIAHAITLHPRVWIAMGWGDIVGSLPANNFDENMLSWTWNGSVSIFDAAKFMLLPPNLAGERVVHLAMSFTQGNLATNIGARNGGGSLRDIIATIPIGETAHGGLHVFRTDDMWLHDFDYRNDTNISDGTLEILDDRFEGLYIPTNHHVSVNLKVYHGDEKRD